MPTAARLFGALSFFALCFAAAEAFKLQMPPGTQFGMFSLICAGIGLICGWRVMGGFVGRGYTAAMGTGIRTAAVAVFFALIGFSLREMLIKAVEKMYHGPMDALQAMVGLMIKYLMLLLNQTDLLILIFGGMAAGLFVEWTSRRWR